MSRVIALLSMLLASGVAWCTEMERLDSLMGAYDGPVPGASVLVLKDGEPVIRRSYGLADLEQGIAAAPETNYRLASITKQFTAAAILLLAEDGKLGLDDRAREWLPSLPESNDAITLRHLLTHTGGLVDTSPVRVGATVTAVMPCSRSLWSAPRAFPSRSSCGGASSCRSAW